MKLEYHVLWFDDTREFLESLDLEPFEAQVRSWGFEPIVQVVSTPEEFMAKQPFSEFDLIAVDYNLGQAQPHGDEFIDRIRGHHVFTEVVFYSANVASDLWRAINERRLEGVYVANRQTIVDKLQSVAYQSVRKVLDLNNVRGMVMAEVGDLDQMLDDILRTALPQVDQHERERIFMKFHEAALEQASEFQQKLDDFKNEPSIERMIELSDSNKRFSNLKRVQKKHAKIKAIDIGDFVADVLTPRNHLAHGQAKAIDGGHSFSWRGKEYVFNDAASVALRKVILAYRQTFRNIHTSVSAPPGA